MRHAASQTFSLSREPRDSRFAFLLLDGFTHLSFSCALEPLRLANTVLGREYYSWRPLSLTGEPVRSSVGIAVPVASSASALEPGETLVILSGPVVPAEILRFTRMMLRREAAHGRSIIGLCGGLVVLADAGLLEGQDCAANAQVEPMLTARFPGVQPRPAAFLLGRFPTASGGTAAADLMLSLIGQAHSADTATRVADLMSHHAVRAPGAGQTASILGRTPLRNPRLSQIVAAMDRSLSAPLSADKLAACAGLSTRQMARLFRSHLQTSPYAFYMSLRLDKARDLLAQTDLSVEEVARATGFNSPAHFARCYRAAFGQSAHGQPGNGRSV